MQNGQTISIPTFTAERNSFKHDVVLGNIGAPLRDADEEWEDFMEDINGQEASNEMDSELMASEALT